MVFSSAIFLFVFFPAVFILYHIVPGLKAKNIILIVASLVFYSFGQPEYLFLLLVSVFINYAAGWALTGAKYRKGILAVAVLLNVGLLSVFKYLDFAMDNINSLFGMSVPLPGIVLPIGISFYTFQGMSYIIDVLSGPIHGEPAILQSCNCISLSFLSSSRDRLSSTMM